MKCKLGFGRPCLQPFPSVEEAVNFSHIQTFFGACLFQEQLCYSLLALYEFVQNGSSVTQASAHHTGGKIYKVCPHQVKKAGVSNVFSYLAIHCYLTYQCGTPSLNRSSGVDISELGKETCCLRGLEYEYPADFIISW